MVDNKGGGRGEGGGESGSEQIDRNFKAENPFNGRFQYNYQPLFA